MKSIKKYITGIALGVVAAGAIVSCDTVDEKFYNPDKLTEADFNLLFSGAQTPGHLFRYDYGATYHYMRTLGKMLGVGASPFYIDVSQYNTVIELWNDWSGSNLSDFMFNQTCNQYSRNINGMKLLYNGMSEEEKAKNAVYMRCCDIIQCYAFQRATDCYDDMPYSEAGGAYEEKFYPKYDTQEEIYTDIMARLKTAAADLSAFEFDTEGSKIKFAASDLLCGGDVDRWIRFANSIRLRMAMRLCHVKPDVAVATIKELVAEDRLLTEASHDIGFEEMDKTHAFELTFYRGIDERAYECGAPMTIVKDIMGYEYQEGDENGITRHDFDPRLFAMFQPDVRGRYIGVPLRQEEVETVLPKYYTEQEIYDMLHGEDAENNGWEPSRVPTMYNRRTYFNFDMKFPVMGSTEVNLLLAEAAVRWPGEFGNIDTRNCIKKAIYASTKFYYDTNNGMAYNESSLPSILYVQEDSKAPTWSEIQSHLSDYQEIAANKFASLSSTKDKLKYIFDQKYCHLNILNPYEIYSEARRLVKDFDGELPFLSTPNIVFMERIYYPSGELSKNKENFDKVAHKNSYDHPVWWTGRTEAAKNHNGNAMR
ncbi:SusD/RagB family nutrient-binding outer membrane lipoprotein [Parabacteroides gordonii]|uniref:SusD/RagB family nutrient-binding outer membrane lipoprotein n=1 Tax=Parabacteroides gordonii TaxID=574930 RepID=UPI0026F36702|nr:SusD/RagB family nutrient-binding outer membrane lipoprotein [Parabacteroides gordonii]